MLETQITTTTTLQSCEFDRIMLITSIPSAYTTSQLKCGRWYISIITNSILLLLLHASSCCETTVTPEPFHCSLSHQILEVPHVSVYPTFFSYCNIRMLWWIIERHVFFLPLLLPQKWWMKCCWNITRFIFTCLYLCSIVKQTCGEPIRIRPRKTQGELENSHSVVEKKPSKATERQSQQQELQQS